MRDLPMAGSPPEQLRLQYSCALEKREIQEILPFSIGVNGRLLILNAQKGERKSGSILSNQIKS